jgi:hypothetical protein
MSRFSAQRTGAHPRYGVSPLPSNVKTSHDSSHICPPTYTNRGSMNSEAALDGNPAVPILLKV